MSQTEGLSLVIIAQVGLDGRWLRVPPPLCKLLGYTRAELSARRFQDVTHPDDLADVWSQCQRLLRGEIKTFGLEKRCLRKDGSIVWVHVKCSVVTDPKGRPVHFLTSLRDISERKQTEEALRRARDYAEKLIQTANVMIVGLDALGTMQVFNRAAEELTGYTREELAHRNWFEVLVPRDRYPEVWQEFNRLLAGGLPKVFENPILTKTGEERLISWRNSELWEDGRIVGTISFGIDLTERKRAEAALQRAHAELEQRVQERTAELSALNRALAAEVLQRRQAEEAHRHVLRRVVEVQETERRRVSRELHDRMGQELIALKLGLKVLTEHGQLTAAAAQQARRLAGIADALTRSVHHLAWDLRPPVLDDFGLDTALRRYALDWAERTRVPVDFHSRGLEGLRLATATEAALYRVAQEALTNVLRHARASAVSVLIERRPDHVLLIVEDNGRGFDVEAVLGAPDAAGKLGLLGMQERVTLVGGTLNLESTAGRGTTVFVRVPWPPAEEGL